MTTQYIISNQGNEALDELRDQGFRLPSKPADPVSLPPDPSALSSEDLMNSFSLFTAWCDFASAQVGLAVIAEREMELVLEKAEAQAWQDIPPRTPVTAAKAAVSLNASVLEAKQKVNLSYAYRRMVTDLAARYERDAAVLSRELTRRTAEYGPRASRREKWST